LVVEREEDEMLTFRKVTGDHGEKYFEAAVRLANGTVVGIGYATQKANAAHFAAHDADLAGHKTAGQGACHAEGYACGFAGCECGKKGA
jgi:hypothetical protein